MSPSPLEPEGSWVKNSWQLNVKYGPCPQWTVRSTQAAPKPKACRCNFYAPVRLRDFIDQLDQHAKAARASAHGNVRFGCCSLCLIGSLDPRPLGRCNASFHPKALDAQPGWASPTWAPGRTAKCHQCRGLLAGVMLPPFHGAHMKGVTEISRAERDDHSVSAYRSASVKRALSGPALCGAGNRMSRS